MSKILEKKLLAEAFNAIAVDNDVEKATRLFKRHLDLVAKTQYSLLEAEDSDFEVTDMGDEFNNEIINSEDGEDTFEQAQIAIDELESHYTGEDKEDFIAKLNDLRNTIDEMKLSDEDVEIEDAQVIIEDLKADCEASECLTDEVETLFSEIETALFGTSDEAEDLDVESMEDEVDTEVEVEETEELSDEDMIAEEVDDLDVDVDFEEPTAESEEGDEDMLDDEVDTEVEVETSDEDKSKDKEEILYDIKDDVEELLAKLDEIESDEMETVDECFTKMPDQQKKMSSEQEGVDKKRTMNFSKLSSAKLDKKAKLGIASANSQGKSAEPKVKTCGYEQKGTKAWQKVAKPENSATSAKSPLGK